MPEQGGAIPAHCCARDDCGLDAGAMKRTRSRPHVRPERLATWCIARTDWNKLSGELIYLAAFALHATAR